MEAHVATEWDLLPRLLFNNPVFDLGINLTCRRGTKWSGISGKLALPNHQIGLVDRTVTIAFKDLTDADLVHEHDPICRTVNGLYKVMQETYKDFDSREIVTLVYFILLKD